ncbi:glycosyltransferase family 2 protein [Parasphingorhabdus pacifica]
MLAVLVCHNGEKWLPEVLDALRELTVGPRHLLAVDTGSTDNTPQLLAEAAEGEEPLLGGVLTVSGETGFGAAVAQALEHATEHWSDPGRWLWLVHDDSAPEPDCLENLLRIADTDSTAGMLGPLALDWADPRLVVDAGLSTDAAGNRQTGIDPAELDPALGGELTSAPVSEVLAVSTAGALINRDVFERLGGLDRALPLAGDDIDFGWRVNAGGHPVLCVPTARIRHVAALRAGQRDAEAVVSRGLRTQRIAERRHGVRTFLVNTTGWSFVFGVPRLALLAVARASGFVLLRRFPEASAEIAVLGALLNGRMGLLAARATRRTRKSTGTNMRGLLTSRLTRSRNCLRAAFAGVIRNRIQRDLVLGSRSAEELVAVPAQTPRPVGRDAPPAGAPGEGRRRSVAGLRKPAAPVVVPVEATAVDDGEEALARPSPVPRDEPMAGHRLLLVPVDRWRIVREVLLAPPVLMASALVLLALLTHGLADASRLGTELHGGRLLPVGDLARTWSDYLESWHAVTGGTGSPAPVSLLVLALVGTVLLPIGGPPTAVALLLLFGTPLAGLSAYRAARALPVSATWRAAAATGYALLPAATLSAGQGRLDVVVAHILAPVLLAGIASVVGLSGRATVPARSGHWMGTACLTALGMAVVGAFSPTTHVTLLVLALVGFVLVPGRPGGARRRVAGLAAIVLLPVACLLPWPVVLAENPQILLHGLGARAAEASAGAWVFVLSPDGSVASSAGGLLVPAAAVAIWAARGRRRTAVPGLVVAGAGWAAALVLAHVRAEPIGGGPATPGWTGAPLVLVAAGLMWVVLCGKPRSLPKWAGPALAAALLVVVAGAVFAGRSGPLSTETGRTAPALAADLAAPGALLTVEPGDRPARLVDGVRPSFGDDDLVPVGTAVDWLHRVHVDLLSDDRERIREALAAAAARGVAFVAAPEPAADRIRSAAGDLAIGQGRLADGSAALRLLVPNSEVELLGPDLARKARAEQAPAAQDRPLPVRAELPNVAVRVSEGGAGRALVLAAENEPGWQATIDGRAAPLASAWGNQVAVPLPQDASEVRITYTEVPRTTLLAIQAAAILFTVIGALPERRRLRRERP